MMAFKATQIVLDSIDVGFILFDPVAPKIFYCKHDVGATGVKTFIGNPDINSLSIISNAIPVLT